VRIEKNRRKACGSQIKKIVTFSRIQDDPPIYNLTLVDINPISGLTSDLTVSDNGDRDIILIFDSIKKGILCQQLKKQRAI
jgi:hypothetical protein